MPVPAAERIGGGDRASPPPPPDATMIPGPPRRRAHGAAAALAVVLAGCAGAVGARPTLDDAPSAPPAATAAAASAPSAPEASSPAAAGAGSPPLVAATAAVLPTSVALPVPAPLPLEDDTPEPVIPLGSIVIPAIGIDRPMFEGIRLPTFDLGPGHWPGTAMPGEIGNVVVGGHRTESHADFGDLDRLVAGDEVVFVGTSGARVTYVVASTEVVDPFAAVIVHQTPERTATLFACHPKGSTDQRIVVRLTLPA